MPPTGLYGVRTSLDEDKSDGGVWIRNPDLYDDLEGKRRIIRLTAETGKSIFCEALYADKWYMDKWNDRWIRRNQTIPPPGLNLAFINSWHRIRLGIRRRPQNLTIDYRDAPRPFWWQVRACMDHPQVVVRLATLLGIIGLGLGLLALGLSLATTGIPGSDNLTAYIPNPQLYGKSVGWSLAVSGVLVMVIGLFLGSRR